MIYIIDIQQSDETDGGRVATMTTEYYETGLPKTPQLSAYYFGGSYEVTDGSVRKYYSFGGQSILRDENGLKYMLTAIWGQRWQ